MFSQDEADHDVPSIKMPMPSSKYLSLVAACATLTAVFVAIGEALA